MTKILQPRNFEEKEQESEEPSRVGVVKRKRNRLVIEPTEEPAEEGDQHKHDLSQNESEENLNLWPNWEKSRNGCSGGLIALPANYIWMRRDELGKRGIAVRIIFRRKEIIVLVYRF